MGARGCFRDYIQKEIAKAAVQTAKLQDEKWNLSTAKFANSLSGCSVAYR